MPRRRRPPLAAGVLLAVLPVLAGCSDDAADRRAGDEVTADEAEVLAGLLARNTDEGGADFVATAPFGEDSLLTLTGEIDYADAVGRRRRSPPVARRPPRSAPSSSPPTRCGSATSRAWVRH